MSGIIDPGELFGLSALLAAIHLLRNLHNSQGQQGDQGGCQEVAGPGSG